MSTRLGPGGFPQTGSNTYNLSLSEAASAASSQTDTATFAPSLAETASANAAQSGAAHFGPSLSESAAAADSPSVHTTAAASLSEAVSAADHLSAIAHFVASLIEDASAADLALASGHYLTGLAESAAAADSTSGTIAAPLEALFTVALARRHTSASVKQRNFFSTVGLQMPQGRDCSPMDIGETVTGGIDFAKWLPSGVTIDSIVSVTAVNYFPGGGSAYVTLAGSAQVGTIPINLGGTGTSNTSVLQQWTGAAVGTARITIKITTSDGQTLEAWTHQPVQTPD